MVTAAWIVVGTINFRSCPTADAAVAYTGLAPAPYDSGSSVRGRRHIDRRGNARVRRALYMATLSAAQHNPLIKAVYDRLRAKGKPPKVARCAAARKLMRIAWAVVTKGQDFDPQYQGAAARHERFILAEPRLCSSAAERAKPEHQA